MYQYAHLCTSLVCYTERPLYFATCWLRHKASREVRRTSVRLYPDTYIISHCFSRLNNTLLTDLYVVSVLEFEVKAQLQLSN